MGYLTTLLGLLSWRFHDAATLMHIVPLWLEFLELNGLLMAEQGRKAKQSLGGLLEPIRRLLSGDVDDPRLMDALDTWAT